MHIDRFMEVSIADHYFWDFPSRHVTNLPWLTCFREAGLESFERGWSHRKKATRTWTIWGTGRGDSSPILWTGSLQTSVSSTSMAYSLSLSLSIYIYYTHTYIMYSILLSWPTAFDSRWYFLACFHPWSIICEENEWKLARWILRRYTWGCATHHDSP